MRVLFTLIAVWSASAAVATEPAAWPQFRGPAGAGIAADGARPPTLIGPKTNLKWMVAVPRGASSPVIVGDRLFLTAFVGDKLLTLAYGLGDGAELWRKEAPAGKIEPFKKSESSVENSGAGG